jgi:hypothetical protein
MKPGLYQLLVRDVLYVLSSHHSQSDQYLLLYENPTQNVNKNFYLDANTVGEL